MGLLKHPHPRISPVLCNGGRRLVNLDIYVYFDMRWGGGTPIISQNSCIYERPIDLNGSDQVCDSRMIQQQKSKNE